MGSKYVVIVVGSKGGGGKTPIALTFGLTPFYYLNKSVTFVDLGYVNPDLRRICLNMLLHHTPQDVLVKEFTYTVNSTKKALEMYRISSDGKLFLVSRAERDLYKTMNIKEISTIINTIVNTVNTDFVIVDTNLSLLNFESNFPILDTGKLFLANLWSLSLTSQDLDTIFRPKIRNIMRINNLEDKNILHIFTPRYIGGERGLMLSLAKLMKLSTKDLGEEFFSLKKLLEVYKERINNEWRPITSDEAMDIIREVHNYFIKFKEGAVAHGGRDMVDYLFHILTDRLIHWDYFPMNLLINPAVREELAYFSELFSSTKIKRSHIENFLNNNVLFVKDFLVKALSQGLLFT